MGTAIAIGITPILGESLAGGGGGGVSTGLLQEDGTSFILLETGDYILQES